MTHFNIRVYGLIIQDHKILLSHEHYKGFDMLKFPGGGLEYGEGMIEALRREIKEEMDIEVRLWKHYYTTDFFQKSKFDHSQIISIYYLSEELIPEREYKTDTGVAVFHPLAHGLIEKISMPIDKLVMRMILDQQPGF